MKKFFSAWECLAPPGAMQAATGHSPALSESQFGLQSPKFGSPAKRVPNFNPLPVAGPQPATLIKGRCTMPLYFILAAALVVVDQVVKSLVRANIPLHTAVDFLPGLDLTYVQNTGAAFSLLSSHTWVLALLSGVVSVALAVALAKGFCPAGRDALPGPSPGRAVGNFIDRLLLGFVTDMFATTFVNFAVFNVADIGVVVGGVLLCLHVICSYGKEKKKEEGLP